MVRVRYSRATEDAGGAEGPEVWARVATPHGGEGGGMVTLPEIGDEVLVVFENGDPFNDTLSGDDDADLIYGQAGDDTINGGIGVDTCYQGTGSGPVLNCEVPAPPAAPAAASGFPATKRYTLRHPPTTPAPRSSPCSA